MKMHPILGAFLQSPILSIQVLHNFQRISHSHHSYLFIALNIWNPFDNSGNTRCFCRQ